MQSTFKNLRKYLFDLIFEKSRIGYVKTVKRKTASWKITKNDLLQYPKASFGYQYGAFLDVQNFEILTKIERHDAYHVLVNYRTQVEDEIALQYLCYGNGKRNFYVYGILILGSLLLPEYWRYYKKSYRIGKNANTFHHWNFKNLLHHNLTDLQAIVFSQTYLKTKQNSYETL